MRIETSEAQRRHAAVAIRPQHDIAAFAARLAQASPREIMEAAARAMPERLAVVSSFGTESAVLLKFVADVDRSLPVLFLDTLWLFKETLAYRDTLVARLGLTGVRTIAPSPSKLALRDPKRELCFRDRDACCGIRKVDPLAKELAEFDGWITGRKRFHGGDRAALAEVEADGARLKFNPLARLTRAELDAAFAAAGLPRHPLEGLGFSSVGCVPCTNRPAAGAADRDGRGGSRQDRMRHPRRPACGTRTLITETWTYEPTAKCRRGCGVQCPLSGVKQT